MDGGYKSIKRLALEFRVDVATAMDHAYDLYRASVHAIEQDVRWDQYAAQPGTEVIPGTSNEWMLQDSRGVPLYRVHSRLGYVLRDFGNEIIPNIFKIVFGWQRSDQLTAACWHTFSSSEL